MVIDLKQQVAELIKRKRIEKQLTQKELGKLLGVDDSTVNRYENASANLSLNTIQKIAAALDFKVTISSD